MMKMMFAFDCCVGLFLFTYLPITADVSCRIIAQLSTHCVMNRNALWWTGCAVYIYAWYCVCVVVLS